MSIVSSLEDQAKRKIEQGEQKAASQILGSHYQEKIVTGAENIVKAQIAQNAPATEDALITAADSEIDTLLDDLDNDLPSFWRVAVAKLGGEGYASAWLRTELNAQIKKAFAYFTAKSVTAYPS